MIYDYVKVDKILGKLEIDPNQFHLLYLLYHRKEGETTNAQIERFKEEVLRFMDQDRFRRQIDYLTDKGLIEDLNPMVNEGNKTFRYYDVDNFLVTPKFSKLVFVATEEAGEQLWNKYPARLPINNTYFISRAGDKEKITRTYARKIKNDIAMHEMVISMVKEYKVMIEEGKINAHKIGDFVEGEMWYAIQEILESEKREGSGFGKDL